jgi:hypothetical protein
MVTKVQDNYDEMFVLLEMPPAGLFVTQVEPRLWGKELRMEFRYNAHSGDKEFSVIFKDCSVIRWEDAGSEVDEQDTMADVIGAQIGEDQHRKPAVITTRWFELAITYGELVLHKNW